MKQPLIYIAGKVTGLPFKEAVVKFVIAQKELKKQGFEVVNPIELVQNHLMKEYWDIPLTDDQLWKLAMKLCIKAMLECDAVLLLNDWTQSKGAVIESEIAEKLGIPRFTTTDEILKHYEAKRTADHLHN